MQEMDEYCGWPSLLGSAIRLVEQRNQAAEASADDHGARRISRDADWREASTDPSTTRRARTPAPRRNAPQLLRARLS